MSVEISRDEGERARLVVVTPVKNELWILRKFLETTSRWADDIIIADQASQDGSRELMTLFPKVRVVENRATSFNEPERQRLLLDAAREIPGRKVIVALDADEILSANWETSPEFETLRRLPQGTVGLFRWINLLPGGQSHWESTSSMPFAFSDDGSEHHGKKIHSARVPIPALAPRVLFQDIVVLHYQYLDWERMKSKHRWYQAYEVIENGRTDFFALFFQYNHMYRAKQSALPIERKWMDGYRGIDLTSVSIPGAYWWDSALFEYLRHPEHARKLTKCDVWDWNWQEHADKHPGKRVAVPNFFDRKILGWLIARRSRSDLPGHWVVSLFTRFFGY